MLGRSDNERDFEYKEKAYIAAKAAFEEKQSAKARRRRHRPFLS